MQQTKTELSQPQDLPLYQKISQKVKKLQECSKSQPDDQDISSNWIEKNEDLQSLEKDIELKYFKKEIEDRDLEMEFRVLRRITETQFHAKNLFQYDPKIIKFNRYNNIIPYTHTICRAFSFECESDPSPAEYINANYISTGQNEEYKFIATQGPLKTTVQNFWKMIWNEECNFIIMLCQLTEEGKVQCYPYWPNNEEQPLMFPEESKCELKVSLINTVSNAFDIIERQFLLERIINGVSEKRQISQLQIKFWQDHGVPQSSQYQNILNLINLILQHYLENKSNKTTIHCSAGVGRTGTIISIFNIILKVLSYNTISLQQQQSLMQLEGSVSVFREVRKLREQRWGMVNTPEQYKYIYTFMNQFIDDVVSKNSY